MKKSLYLFFLPVLCFLLLGVCVARSAHAAPRVHCNVLVAPGQGVHGCFPVLNTLYTWQPDGRHASPRYAVPSNWNIVYICDGASDIVDDSLFINQRLILRLTCDNAWHLVQAQPFARSGFIVLYLHRGGVIVHVVQQH